jgi:hypothetical protein
MTTERHRASAAWGGWIAFAAIVMFVVGGVNAIQGLAAVLKDEVYLVTESGLLVTADFTVWGWTLLIWGIVMALAGAGLVSGHGWARWFAVAVVVLNLFAQFAWFPAYPLWSLVAIGLNVAVLYALTVRWEEAQAGLGT